MESIFHGFLMEKVYITVNSQVLRTLMGCVAQIVGLKSFYNFMPVCAKKNCRGPIFLNKIGIVLGIPAYNEHPCCNPIIGV